MQKKPGELLYDSIDVLCIFFIQNFKVMVNSKKKYKLDFYIFQCTVLSACGEEAVIATKVNTAA